MFNPIPVSAANMSAATPEDISALARTYGRAVFRFLRLIEDPPTEVRSWPAFLTTAATRLAIDYIRRQRRWALLAPLWKTEESDDAPDEDVERAEAGRIMRHALARMNPRDASCLVLRHVHGMSPAEIAATLGTSENNVSVITHRARKALEALHAKELNR